MTAPWLLVAGDLTPLGGMDAANHALARYLASRGDDVHIVTHRAWPDLVAAPTVTVHRVWRPFHRHVLGGPLLSLEGRRTWRRLGGPGVRAVLNGGNCQVAGANWVHYLHAAYRPQNANVLRRVKGVVTHHHELAAEHAALECARLVICNSEGTRRLAVERLGIAEARTQVVYYGSDPVRFARVSPETQRDARIRLALPLGRPLAGFVGALGDRRKAFDTLYAAWSVLVERGRWDTDLVVVGAGAELPAWRERAREAGLGERIHFMGFRDDVPDVLAALDVLVHPARYEAYGLSVHEAICRGVPALVSSSAGVAERYPDDLRDLLIEDPDDPLELTERLTRWRADLERVRDRVQPLSDRLRSRTWDHMAAEITALVEQAA
jgi:glycosyltransferase involved in cell wall biosynthesis